MSRTLSAPEAPERAMLATPASVGACPAVRVTRSPAAPVPSSSPAVTPPPSRPAATSDMNPFTVPSLAPDRERGVNPREPLSSSGAGSAVDVVAGQRPDRVLDVRRAHQRLSDQHRVDAHALELVELVAGREAGLRDHGLARGDVREQLVGALDVDREVGQVAVVEA